MKISLQINLLDVLLIILALVLRELWQARKKRSLRISIGGKTRMNFTLKAGANYLIGLFPQTNGVDDPSAVIATSSVSGDPFDPTGPQVKQVQVGETVILSDGSTAPEGAWYADLTLASSGQEMTVTANVTAEFSDGPANLNAQARVITTTGPTPHGLRIQVG